MGRPARLSARAAPDRRRRLVAWEGARGYGIEMRVGPVAITNGSFGNRPHCIYRGFCLEGLQGERQGEPADHAPAGRDRARRGGARRLHGRARRDRRRDRPLHRRHLRRATASSASSAPTPSPLRLRDRDAAAPAQLDEPPLPRGLANGYDQVGRYVMVQGATQVAARFPSSCACTRRRRRRSRPSNSTRPTSARLCARVLDPDGLAAADRLGGARPCRGALGPGAARVHARLQPLDGPRPRSASCYRCPRTA